LRKANYNAPPPQSCWFALLQQSTNSFVENQTKLQSARTNISKTIMTKNDKKYLLQAIALAKKGMQSGEGGPFGAVIIDKNGKVIGEGNNRVTSTNDPTAHAEITAIRDACKNISDFQLEGCTIYSSCEPCPMCLGAIYWSRPDRIVFACSKKDAADIGFDDDFLYKEIPLPLDERKIPTIQKYRAEGLEVFKLWAAKEDKTEY